MPLLSLPGGQRWKVGEGGPLGLIKLSRANEWAELNCQCSWSVLGRLLSLLSSPSLSSLSLPHTCDDGQNMMTIELVLVIFTILILYSNFLFFSHKPKGLVFWKNKERKIKRTLAHSLQGMYPKCFQRLFHAASQKASNLIRARKSAFWRPPFHAFIYINFIDLNRICVCRRAAQLRLGKSYRLFVKLPRLPITNSVRSGMYRTKHIKLEQNVLANDNPVKYVKRFLGNKDEVDVWSQ